MGTQPLTPTRLPGTPCAVRRTHCRHPKRRTLAGPSGQAARRRGRPARKALSGRRRSSAGPRGPGRPARTRDRPRGPMPAHGSRRTRCRCAALSARVPRLRPPLLVPPAALPVAAALAEEVGHGAGDAVDGVVRRGEPVVPRALPRTRMVRRPARCPPPMSAARLPPVVHAPADSGQRTAGRGQRAGDSGQRTVGSGPPPATTRGTRLGEPGSPLASPTRWCTTRGSPCCSCRGRGDVSDRGRDRRPPWCRSRPSPVPVAARPRAAPRVQRLEALVGRAALGAIAHRLGRLFRPGTGDTAASSGRSAHAASGRDHSNAARDTPVIGGAGGGS